MLCVLVAASFSVAQIIWPPAVFTPAAPTEEDEIQALFTTFVHCNLDVTTVVIGATVRTTVNETGCVVGPPPVIAPYPAVFGPLPAGTYTYEIYVSNEGGPPVLRSTQPLVVAAVVPGVPALSGVALALMIGALTAVAVLALRH